MIITLAGLLLLPAGISAASDDQPSNDATEYCKDQPGGDPPPRDLFVAAHVDSEEWFGVGFDRQFDDSGRGEGVLVCARLIPSNDHVSQEIPRTTNVGVLSSNQTNGVVVLTDCTEVSCDPVLDHTGVTEGEVEQTGFVGVANDGTAVWLDGEQTELGGREASVQEPPNPSPFDTSPGTICVLGECVDNVRVDTGQRLVVHDEFLGIDEERPICVTTNNNDLPCDDTPPGPGPCAAGECLPPPPDRTASVSGGPRL